MQKIVNEALINYEVVGKKQDKTLLILHGWGRSLTEWLPIANAFAEKYQVYVLDLPGFGNSELPQESIANSQWYADVIEQFIKKLKLKNVSALGHSFGGKLLLILATMNLLKKIILVDASGIEKRPLQTKIKIMIFKLFKGLIFVLPTPLRKAVMTWFSRSYYKYTPEVRESLKKVVKEDLSNFAKKIDTETIIIWGENDKIVPTKYARELKNMIKGSTLRIVWGAGHSPHQEKPDRFLQILKEYL